MLKRQGFTLLEVVLAIALATMAVGVIVSVFGATTVGARITHQAEASSQVMALIEEELEQGNAVLTAGGVWDYGELPAVIPVSRQDLNRYRLEIERQGVESFAGGGDVVRYGILLCSMPVGASEESCSQTVFRAPPPAAATSAGVTTDTASQLYIGGEDPTGSANVVATNGTSTQTYTSYGTYALAAGYTVTGNNVVNASGIRYAPEVASGGGAVQVYYKADSGAILVTVGKDEPALTLPAIELTGPAGFSAAVPEGETRFAEAEPGTYRIVAPNATYGGYDYAARYGSSANSDGSFQVTVGAVKRVNLRYVATNGKLRLEFKGGGPAPKVALKRKVGSDYTLLESFVLPTTKSYERMDPATYAVALDGPYQSDGIDYALEFRRYDPSRSAWSPWFKESEARFDLIPGEETVIWMRAYPVTGKVTLHIDGPSDLQTTVTLAGLKPDGSLFKREFTRPGVYTVGNLVPGSYSLQASSGQDSAGNYYLVQGPESFLLAAGEAKDVTLSYGQAQEGTLVVFNVSTAYGPRWENEPAAYKTAVVEANSVSVPSDAWVVHRSFQPFLIPPGKDGWICTEDPITGTFITYKVSSFLQQPQNQWVDCLSYRGNEGSLLVRRVTASVAPISGYFFNEVSVLRDQVPSNFEARFRVEQDVNGGLYVREPAKVRSSDLTEDPNAAGRWRASKGEQLQDLTTVTQFMALGSYTGSQCDFWALDVKVIDPGGVIYTDSKTYSRQEHVTMPISVLGLTGKKAYLSVFAQCP
ncbi:hypothetical protein Ocepr_2360 (plasmid) [Oceanithermus profundus DSM 14977]|uniref:Prepilin-type N-terminal cleavage/methylation domain-containing protein n=1 Tax=Oceanithermus profundus (strain DSM 14977 / NBRC 100410 / VKM B-2274 / 506) TaxID=670487 RepID=E4UAM9_OCEP5|nr:hypothetical protein Ocepr_2360 [Oceanithermus profundus DSM 14977]